MIERYALFEIGSVSQRFAVNAGMPSGVHPRYNIAPTQLVPVVVSVDGERQIRRMKWGFVAAGARDTNSVFRYKTFDAKSEGIFAKPIWKHAIHHQRCLVPANGFYAWQKTSDGQVPYYFRHTDQAVMGLAGVYSSWTDPDGVEWGTFAIISAPASRDTAAITPRLPVVVRPEDEATWLDPSIDDFSSLYDIMRPLAGGMLSIQPVNPRIRSIKADGAELLIAPR